MLNNLVERVRHDGNEHVENRDLRNESRKDEDCVAQTRIRMIVKSIDVELTENEQVLIEHCVNHEVIKDGVDDVVVSLRTIVELEHIDGNADVKEKGSLDDKEVTDVYHSLNNQRYVECSLSKESQPVNDNLDTLCEYDEDDDISLESHTRAIESSHVSAHD